jgi:hypothetical protein
MLIIVGCGLLLYPFSGALALDETTKQALGLDKVPLLRKAEHKIETDALAVTSPKVIIDRAARH